MKFGCFMKILKVGESFFYNHKNTHSSYCLISGEELIPELTQFD
jgi:hypothetical protein